jgi:hypothetical protein
MNENEVFHSKAAQKLYHKNINNVVGFCCCIDIPRGFTLSTNPQDKLNEVRFLYDLSYLKAVDVVCEAMITIYQLRLLGCIPYIINVEVEPRGEKVEPLPNVNKNESNVHTTVTRRGFVSYTGNIYIDQVIKYSTKPLLPIETISFNQIDIIEIRVTNRTDGTICSVPVNCNQIIVEGVLEFNI